LPPPTVEVSRKPRVGGQHAEVAQQGKGGNFGDANGVDIVPVGAVRGRRLIVEFRVTTNRFALGSGSINAGAPIFSIIHVTVEDKF